MPEQLNIPTANPFLYPLDELYARAGRTLPQIERVRGEEIPEPFRTLLVHESDMTPTLEKHHQGGIHLKILHREQRDDTYFREVVLLLHGSEKPVEFGANKVSLLLFPPRARQLILEEQVPLGRILKDCEIGHTTHAKAFFRVTPDSLITEVFGLKKPVTLFGRRAAIHDLQKRPLSEIVEILPPEGGSGRS